jgi:hypothetical protein
LNAGQGQGEHRVSCGLDHDQRRAELTAAHGPARTVPAGPVLALLGWRAVIHPRDAVAYAYRDWAAAQAWCASTADHYGLVSLGFAAARGLDGPEVFSAYDLRAILGGTGLTDPARPDDWTPPLPRPRRA